MKGRKRLNSRLHNFGKKQLGNKLKMVCAENGIELKEINPAYTSQSCNVCFHTERANRKGERFKCKACGHQGHADVNAAKNISERSSFRLTTKKEIRYELMQRHKQWQEKQMNFASGVLNNEARRCHSSAHLLTPLVEA